MKNKNPLPKSSNPGAHDDMTTHEAKKTSARPTAYAIRGARPIDVAASRAIDQELEWYFSYAEGALRHASLPMLPSYAVVAGESTETELQARATDIANSVRIALFLVGRKRAEILRSVYTPRSWPRPVRQAFGPLASIVVRLVFAEDPWPERSAREGLEQAAAARLSGLVRSKGTPLAHLRRQAKRLLGGAIVSYAGMRTFPAPSAAATGCR